jgi:uncharacterized OsmC-like protein
METTVRYSGSVSFEVETRGHRIICDQPVENGGSDTGLTPPEFLLASLGTCAGYYAAEYLRARHVPAEGLEIQVFAEKAQQPARISKFRIEVRVPSIADERHREGLLRSVKRCLIHNTLTNPPQIETLIALNTGTEAAAAPCTYLHT